jgi:hypothetical protein
MAVSALRWCRDPPGLARPWTVSHGPHARAAIECPGLDPGLASLKRRAHGGPVLAVARARVDLFAENIMADVGHFKELESWGTTNLFSTIFIFVPQNYSPGVLWDQGQVLFLVPQND